MAKEYVRFWELLLISCLYVETYAIPPVHTATDQKALHTLHQALMSILNTIVIWNDFLGGWNRNILYWPSLACQQSDRQVQSWIDCMLGVAFQCIHCTLCSCCFNYPSIVVCTCAQSSPYNSFFELSATFATVYNQSVPLHVCIPAIIALITYTIPLTKS